MWVQRSPWARGHICQEGEPPSINHALYRAAGYSAGLADNACLKNLPGPMILLAFLLGLCGLCFPALAEPLPTRTIIDVLSESPEFSVLVELLQHHELIPFFNQSWNSTLLAPLNTAFVGIDTKSITTEQLLYHFINATVVSADFAHHTRVENTYLDHGNALIMLDLEQGVNNGKAEFEEVDMMASPQRGLVHAITTLLAVPDTISAQMFMHNDLQLFSDLVGKQDLSGSTVFAPTSEGLLSWLSHEMNTNSTRVAYDYLNSPFGDEDRDMLVSELIYPGILSPDSLPRTLKLSDGTYVTVHRNYTVTGENFSADSKGKLHVARDGLFVETTNVAVPRSLLEITPAKFILGLGGYRLVRALDLYGHYKLIDETSLNSPQRMIIVPTGNGPAAGAPKNDFSTNADLSNLMLYQFIDGHLPNHRDGKLLKSQMRLRSGKYPQRVHFEHRTTGSKYLNWEVITSDAYRLGNTTFYTTDELLSTPPSLTIALGPLLVSSHSLTFLEKIDRLQLPQSKSWTVLVPTRDAWEQNMLLKNYLDTNTEALERVFDNLIFDVPMYSDSGSSMVHQFSGDKTDLSWNPEGRVLHVNNSKITGDVNTEVTDVLFDNGVAHVVTNFSIPVDLEISAVDLIKSGGRSVFLDLLHAANMQQVLDPHANYTLLVPPDKDFIKHNITTRTDPKELQAVLTLHLLPENPIRQLLDGESGKTLSGEEVEIHETSTSSNVYALVPSGASGQQVLLTAFGDTNGYVASGSTVIFLDRYISPQWMLPPKFGLHSGTYTVLGILIGLVLACLLIFGLALRISKPGSDLPQDSEGSAAASYHDETDEENDNDISSSNPIQVPAVNEERAYGRHLDLPH